MNTKERLETNKQKIQEIGQQLETLSKQQQALVQELLKLDGENRLLAEMNHNQPEKDTVAQPDRPLRSCLEPPQGQGWGLIYPHHKTRPRL